jgi:DNA end-binding protein Ku
MASRGRKSNGHAHDKRGDGADGESPAASRKSGRRARGLWNGAISFSLVHIPVSLHTAARSSTIDLDLLDKRDFAPVGYQRYNKSTGKTVDWDDVVKGYEYEKGEYVVLTDEDFRRANVEASRTIDIQTFVDRDAIAPYYFDTPYFLVPDKGGERVYTLLREALEQSKKLAVATFVLRSRQHVAALMPVDQAIVLNTLRYEDEIQPAPQTASTTKKAGATGREVEMALKLIDEMTGKWQPGQFHDTYRNDLMKRIGQKIKSGQTHALTQPEEETTEPRAAGGKVVDLMSLLERSLAQRSSGDGAAPRAAKRKHSAARRRSSNVRAARRA